MLLITMLYCSQTYMTSYEVRSVFFDLNNAPQKKAMHYVYLNLGIFRMLFISQKAEINFYTFCLQNLFLQ